MRTTIMNESPAIMAEPEEAQTLVVVHKNDGSTIRATLPWSSVPDHPVALPPLPSDLRVWNEAGQEHCAVDLKATKAVFFVKTHEGSQTRHDRVSFFSDNGHVRNLWVCVRMTDGELLEGRTVNDAALLTKSGLWLWPTDFFNNNRLIYIPKTSVLEFHVMGLQGTRPGA